MVASSQNDLHVWVADHFAHRVVPTISAFSRADFGVALTVGCLDEAYAFVAVSNGDNSNIVAARVARESFGVDNVVARIYDSRRADVYERSIETVRLDPGEIVRSRRMTEKEKENALQRGLFDEPAKAIADATRKGAAEEREPDEDAVDVDANNAVDHGDPGSIDNPTAPPEAPAAEPEPESADA